MRPARFFGLVLAGSLVFCLGLVSLTLAQTYVLRRSVAGIGITQAADDGSPSGMVAAFNLASCPSGWTAFSAANGRTVIGTNAGGNGLSSRALGATGGEETHLLTVDEMPSHHHALVRQGSVGGQYGVVDSGNSGSSGTPNSGDTGGDLAHNNMQPFVALLYCSKD